LNIVIHIDIQDFGNADEKFISKEIAVVAINATTRIFDYDATLPI